ncbi:MAG TPA: hypothetical protein VK572_00305 [Burkholderiales bacterium]|nr:hypothetical protein [Burkholderiales bacterium]
MTTTASNAFAVQVAAALPLAQAAAVMAPGSWATFNCNYSTGTLSALLDVGGGKRCTEYSDKMIWDSGRKQIYFTGGGHGQQEKTIVYSDATNTWTDLGSPPWFSVNPGGATHGYQHNAFFGSTQYYLQFATAILHTRDVVSGAWGVLSTNGIDLGSDGALGSAEWFPTFGTGSLIIVDGNGGGVYRWNGASWSVVGTPTMGGYHNVGVYSPIKDLLYFGGGNGSTQLYTMSKTGVITARANCPIDFGIVQSCTTVDPVSGKLVLACIDQVIRVYDPVTNTWTTDTAPPVGFWSGTIYSEGAVMGITAAPIYDYGVTMFITISGPTIYLRKGR